MVVITGATGRTGSLIADILLKKGEKVRCVGRSEERLRRFKHSGAEIAVGDQVNARFLADAFSHADSAYVLIPFDPQVEDINGYYERLGETATAAIKKSGIRRILFLSSLGAGAASGAGPVNGLHSVEQKLRWLLDVDFAILRPAYFMENTVHAIPDVKLHRMLGGSIEPNARVCMVACRDIAALAAKLLTDKSFSGITVIDLIGDRIAFWQATQIIGKAVGMPDLPYFQFSDDEAFKAFRSAGFSESAAAACMELNHALSEGKIQPTQIDPEKPNSPTHFKQFVEEVFKPAYVRSI